MSQPERVYLALGDSMSIDDYTGVEGGGAASQFYRSLGEGWRFDDRTLDGCRMPHVPRDATGHVITLTIGGNDLLWNQEEYLAQGLEGFGREHLALLESLRRANPNALLIVGDIYHPDAQLDDRQQEALAAANRAIRSNCLRVGARLAAIYETFRGHEKDYLCLQIEPALAGATAIAELFQQAYRDWAGATPS